MTAIRSVIQPVRALRKSPGLAVTVVLLLGFGIGANSALFSLLHAVLLQPIPGVERSEDLVRVRRSQNGRVQSNQSYPDYLDFRDRARSTSVAAERLGTMLLAGPPAQMIPAAIITGNYFEMLGAHAVAGRLFSADDERVPGGHPVAVLSESFWKQQYGGGAAIVGSSIVLNGHPFTVVGVVAAPFEGVAYGGSTAVWIPIMMVRQFMTRVPDNRLLTLRSAGWLTMYARLGAGIRLETAAAEWNTIAAQLEERYPDSNKSRRFELNRHANMSPQQRESLRSLLGLLLAAVCLVLLIACGNVATLLLARAAARSREMAIRLALGAGRSALLMQVLSESLVLGLAGAVLGMLLAPWMLSLLRGIWEGPEFAAASASLDARLMGFTLAVSLLSVLLFGLAPAWAASRTDPGGALKSGSRRAGSTRLQRAWVIAQVTLSVALVAGGSLVLRSMQRIVAIDPGYRPQRVVMAAMDLSVLGYPEERGMQIFADLLTRAAAMPGVSSATLAKSTPAIDWSDRTPVFAQGASADAALETDANIVAPGYFRTLGIPLLSGRDFTAADRDGAPLAAIVSRSLAERLWPGQNPIGKKLFRTGRPAPPPLEVIGVAAESRYRSVLNDAAPLLYLPLWQNYDSISRLMISVEGDASQYRNPLLQTIRQANPALPVRMAVTMREQIEHSVWRQRAAAALLSFFGLLAVALACAGIHSMVAYSAAQRTREIGIRMALGATKTAVLGQVVSSGVRFTLAGIALGLPLALWAKSALQAFLYAAPVVEPVAFVGVPLLFMAVAVAASFVPARRAAATDPTVALRHD